METNLIDFISSSATVEDALAGTTDRCSLPDIAVYLQTMIDTSPYTTRQFFDKVAMERTAGFRIMDGQRKPSRNVLVRIALLMGLTVAKTQELLTVGGKACLNPMQKRDVVLLWALTHHLDGTQAEEALQKIGVEGLYRGK